MMQICPIITVDAVVGTTSTTLIIVIVIDIVIVIRCCWRVEYQMSQCLMCVRWYCRFKGDVLSCVAAAAAAAAGVIVIAAAAAAILVLHIIIFTNQTLLLSLLLLPLLHLPFLLLFGPYTMWTTKVGYACTSGYTGTR
jgi:hypothetical protein